jgi:ketosteroid isomerase-like protein
VSEADVEVIREVYARFNARDYDGSAALLHDDVELYQASEIPGATVSVGRLEFQRGIADWLSGFERGFQYEVLDLVDCEPSVFARLMLHGTGRGSGVEINREIFNVWEVRDDKAWRCRVYWNEDDARHAAGLADSA